MDALWLENLENMYEKLLEIWPVLEKAGVKSMNMSVENRSIQLVMLRGFPYDLTRIQRYAQDFVAPEDLKNIEFIL